MEYANESAGAKIVEEEEGEKGNMVIKDISKSEDLWIRNPIYYKIVFCLIWEFIGTHGNLSFHSFSNNYPMGCLLV